ncbi:MAG: metalloregulator ArsR/SmtB family transcription factor [Dehalococcoidia bacterium]
MILVCPKHRQQLYPIARRDCQEYDGNTDKQSRQVQEGEDEPVRACRQPTHSPVDKVTDTWQNIGVDAHIRTNFNMRELVKSFKALSDETRLRILKLLLERECCVCEVMQALDISQTRASRNLSALYDAGFLQLRKEGLWSLYSIDQEGVKAYISDLIEAVDKGLEGKEVAAQDRERLRKAKRVGPECVQRSRR